MGANHVFPTNAASEVHGHFGLAMTRYDYKDEAKCPANFVPVRADSYFQVPPVVLGDGPAAWTLVYLAGIVGLSQRPVVMSSGSSASAALRS